MNTISLKQKHSNLMQPNLTRIALSLKPFCFLWSRNKRQKGTRLQGIDTLASVALAPVLATLLVLGLLAPSPLYAGAAAGGASEWTQILNNVELAGISSLNAKELATAAKSYTAQVRQLQTQIQAYQNMVANTKNLPTQFLKEAALPILDLKRMFERTGSLISEGRNLDTTLTQLTLDNTDFNRDLYTDNNFATKYDEQQVIWSRVVAAGLEAANMTFKTVEDDALFLDGIIQSFGNEAGRKQVLQKANALSASLNTQLLSLRGLTAAHSQAVEVGWSRVLTDMDAKEASQRQFEQGVKQTQENLENVPEGRSVNEILGIK